MDNKEFFNSMAYKWDEFCEHDEGKLKEIFTLSDVRKNSKILDVGTGTGVLIPYLLETSPAKITAIDISENMISVAKQKCNDERVNFIVEDVMKYKKEQFDYIFLYSVYPHFPDKEALFSQLEKILNDNGKIIIAHSQSKEEINKIHQNNEQTKDDGLLPVKDTAKIMSKYFEVGRMIDNDEMYYIIGFKQ